MGLIALSTSSGLNTANLGKKDATASNHPRQQC